MKQTFDFDDLATLLQKTHEEMLKRANRSVNLSLVVRNWLFGWYIAEFEQKGDNRAEYGSQLIKRLADELKLKNLKGVSITSLKQYRSFFHCYKAIGQALSDQSTNVDTKGQAVPDFSLLDQHDDSYFLHEACQALLQNFSLSWTHYVVLLTLKNAQERSFYEIEATGNNWSTRELEQFLLELGKGFLFEARQKRFTFDNNHFYVDLVFYNRLLRCYVLIDLKRGELNHQDLGQMQMYVNYFDRYVTTDAETPTIGILLCHQKNDAVVELTLPEDNNIYASEYQLYLPSKEEFKAKLLEIEAEFEREIGQGTVVARKVLNGGGNE